MGNCCTTNKGDPRRNNPGSVPLPGNKNQSGQGDGVLEKKESQPPLAVNASFDQQKQQDFDKGDKADTPPSMDEDDDDGKDNAGQN